MRYLLHLELLSSVLNKIEISRSEVSNVMLEPFVIPIHTWSRTIALTRNTQECSSALLPEHSE